MESILYERDALHSYFVGDLTIRMQEWRQSQTKPNREQAANLSDPQVSAVEDGVLGGNFYHRGTLMRMRSHQYREKRRDHPGSYFSNLIDQIEPACSTKHFIRMRDR